MVHSRTAGVVVVPPASIAEGRVKRHQIGLEMRIRLHLRVVAVAGVVHQNTARIELVTHGHLLIILLLRPRSPLIMHVVDYQARMAAVTHYHTAQFLIAVCEIEAALNVVIIKLRDRILVSSRLLPIEQSELIRPLEDIALPDCPVEIQHVQPHSFGGLHLTTGQFIRRHDSVLRPEAPGDGRAQHYAPSVEIELPVPLDVTDLKPAETETAGVAVFPESNAEIVQIWLFYAPQLCPRKPNGIFKSIFTGFERC